MRSYFLYRLGNGVLCLNGWAGALMRRLAESRWVGTEIENFLSVSEDREAKRATDILGQHRLVIWAQLRREEFLLTICQRKAG